MKHDLGKNTQAVRALIVAAALAVLPGCVKLSRRIADETSSTVRSAAATRTININTASVEELAKLPGIGKVLAARIVQHRQNYGPFRRPEHLIVVRGISDRRFRLMRALVMVE